MLSRIFYTPRLENLRMFVCCVTRISVSVCLCVGVTTGIQVLLVLVLVPWLRIWEAVI